MFCFVLFLKLFLLFRAILAVVFLRVGVRRIKRARLRYRAPSVLSTVPEAQEPMSADGTQV